MKITHRAPPSYAHGVYHLAMHRRCRKSLSHISNTERPSIAYPQSSIVLCARWSAFMPYRTPMNTPPSISITLLGFWSITKENVWSLLVGKRHEHVTKRHEIDRFCGVIRKSSCCRIGTALRCSVSRKGDDWNGWVAMRFLPRSDFSACLVAVLFGHLNVALRRHER